MKIQVVSRSNAGCDWYRCVLPAIYLQQDKIWSADNQVELLWISQEELQIDCDILIYNKLIGTSVEDLRAMQRQGMRIVVDIDDMWVLPSWHSNKEWNRSGNPQVTINHMRLADAVTCTSERLAVEIRKYNNNVHVIPNALPYGDKGYSRYNHQSSNRTRFLYAGGVSHLPDVKLLEGKFQRIGSDPFIKNNAEFILAGYEQAQQRIYNTPQDRQALNSNYTTAPVRGPYDDMELIFSRTGSYQVLPTKHVMEYLTCYDQADVVLAPITDDPWNSYKSVLKVLEAASRQLPIICSAAPPYSDLKPCEGIMFVNHPDDWLKMIRHCTKNPLWVKEQGLKLSQWVTEQYNLPKWNQYRKQLFNELYSSVQAQKSHKVS